MKLGPNQTKWVEALESGKFDQGKNALCMNDRYCCLGVACEISDIGVEKTIRDNLTYYGDGSQAAPEIIWKHYGLRDAIGEFKMAETHDGEIFKALTEMNDSGMTFKEIAKYIRKNPENVFSESK